MPLTHSVAPPGKAASPQAEQEDKERRKKEKAEAHLYTLVRVSTDADVAGQVGTARFFDLVDHEQASLGFHRRGSRAGRGGRVDQDQVSLGFHSRGSRASRFDHRPGEPRGAPEASQGQAGVRAAIAGAPAPIGPRALEMLLRIGSLPGSPDGPRAYAGLPSWQ